MLFIILFIQWNKCLHFRTNLLDVSNIRYFIRDIGHFFLKSVVMFDNFGLEFSCVDLSKKHDLKYGV